MRHRLVLLLLIISMLSTISISVIYASDVFKEINGKRYFEKDGRLIPLPDSIKESINLSGKCYSINADLFLKKGYVVYGSVLDIKDNDNKIDYQNIKQYRYLGYDVNGNYYTNIDFPDDVNLNLMPWEKTWISKPWLPSSGKLCNKSIYNERYPKETTEFLKLISYKGQYWAGKNGWTATKLLDYFNIQTPPTDISPGTAIGWHIKDGHRYYQTFMLLPNMVDYQADTLKIPKTAVVGSNVTATVNAKCFSINGNPSSGTTKAAWFIDNAIKANNNAFQISGTKNTRVSFTMPNHDVKVRFYLNYSKDTPATECGFGFDNNYVEEVIKVVSATPTKVKTTQTPTPTPTPSPRIQTPVPTDSSKTWTEIVNEEPKVFHAQLSVSVDEVREVYGNGKDKINPTQMKSGYGVEVTVTTHFTTDYPGQASGPIKVQAILPDGVELLECTNAVGSNVNTWRFRINTKSGLNRREHYIPVEYPDNKNYTMIFQASGAYAGQSGELIASAQRNIYIKGSMYDDDHTGGAR